jgi:chloramphenicol-sensitive protein RarD
VNRAAGGEAAGALAKAGDTREGFIYALCAYLFWGFVPFYMKAVAYLPSVEVVAHRIFWSVPLAGILLVALGRTGDIRLAIRSPRTLAQAGLTAMLISVNWYIYVWSIASGRTLETALGYYINPLLSVLLAFIFLGERLTTLQILAIGFAVAGVSLMTWQAGGLPWASIGLAVTWGLYALFKRTLPIGPAQGFFMEILLLTPLATLYILWIGVNGNGHFLTGVADTLLLALAGVVTAVPLILYANAAKKLRLTTIGIMQYIAPTMIFLVAVLVFREPFDLTRLAAFALIWTALFIYSFGLLRMRQGRDSGKGRPATGS